MNDQFLGEDFCFIDSMKSKLGIDGPFPQELIDGIRDDVVLGVAKEKGVSKDKIEDILSNISIEMKRVPDLEVQGAIVTWILSQLPISLQKLIIEQQKLAIKGVLLQNVDKMDDSALSALAMLVMMSKISKNE